MRAKVLMAAVASAGVVLVGGACGGETVVTVTTDTVPTTTDATTTATTTATTATTLIPPDPVTTTGTTTAPSGALGDLLPPADAYPGTTAGTVDTLATARAMTDRLYASGDPARIPAAAKLEAAGYGEGVLRDDRGTDPATGVALLRTYIFTVRDAAAASAEVTDSADEVLRTRVLDTEQFSIAGVPGARGVTASGTQSGQGIAVMYITFPVGERVYGLQAVAANLGAIDSDRLQDLARNQYRAATGG